MKLATIFMSKKKTNNKTVLHTKPLTVSKRTLKIKALLRGIFCANFAYLRSYGQTKAFA